MKVIKYLIITGLLLCMVNIPAFALNAGNIDLIYYNNTTHKPIYEIQFLKIPIAYDTSHTPKLIIYGAGTTFSIRVTNYESYKGGLIVKLVNVYDNTERVLGYLSNSEISKVFNVSNLYPGYWTIVLVPSGNLPEWNIANASAPTNAGAHEIKIVGNPKLILQLLSPVNISIGDIAKIRIKIEGLYGKTNVTLIAEGKKTLRYTKVLGNGENVWDVELPTEKLGIGKCKVIVKAMGISGNLEFNIVKPTVKLNNTTINNTTKHNEKNMRINNTNVTNRIVNATNNNSMFINNTFSNNKTTNKTKVKINNKTKFTNSSNNISKTKEAKRTPGFCVVIALISLLLALRKRN